MEVGTGSREDPTDKRVDDVEEQLHVRGLDAYVRKQQRQVVAMVPSVPYSCEVTQVFRGDLRDDVVPRELTEPSKYLGVR